ncbi:MAG: DUF2726 domain-containing protein [Azonexus sp.]|jgi:hypothetical protein|nr:DUF2726 domain-containing protein [Azonexus sp.]
MKTLFILAILFALIGFLAMVAMAMKRGGQGSKPPYFLQKPLTAPEQTLFHRLREAFPEAVVLAQVSMYAVVGIRKKGNPAYRGQFNKIRAKSLDFVICRPDFSVIAAIELDDASHRDEWRQKGDADKNAAFAVLDVPLIRFDVRQMPGVDELKSAIPAGKPRLTKAA